MITLALEFSTSRRSVAVVENGVPRATAHENGAQQTRAFDMITRVLELAGARRTDVGCIAIGLGPGSYAGVRVALALATGWQFATGIPTVGVSTAAVLAETARREGRRGRLAVLIDAQRGEYYLSRWQLDETGSHEIEGLRIATHAEIERLLATGHLAAGPDLPAALPEIANLHPDAAVLGQLAQAGAQPRPVEQLEPIYLRPVAFVKAPPPRTDL